MKLATPSQSGNVDCYVRGRRTPQGTRGEPQGTLRKPQSAMWGCQKNGCLSRARHACVWSISTWPLALKHTWVQHSWGPAPAPRRAAEAGGEEGAMSIATSAAMWIGWVPTPPPAASGPWMRDKGAVGGSGVVEPAGCSHGRNPLGSPGSAGLLEHGQIVMTSASRARTSPAMRRRSSGPSWPISWEICADLAAEVPKGCDGDHVPGHDALQLQLGTPSHRSHQGCCQVPARPAWAASQAPWGSNPQKGPQCWLVPRRDPCSIDLDQAPCSWGMRPSEAALWSYSNNTW
jgi:hypothetical protein